MDKNPFRWKMNQKLWSGRYDRRDLDAKLEKALPATQKTEREC
jgi:hypothetical protein